MFVYRITSVLKVKTDINNSIAAESGRNHCDTSDNVRGDLKI